MPGADPTSYRSVLHVTAGLFYTAVNQKPKRMPRERLARLQNIRAVPSVALLVDEYDEDWTQLWFILVRGTAKLIPDSAHQEHA